jgi:hypothetical protein
MTIWGTYTASLSEKAILRQHLEAWRGKPFTPEELEGFELDVLLGKPVMISVLHRESNGKTYANISSLSRLPKGMEAPKAEGELISFDPRQHTQAQLEALPEWLQNRVNDGLENMHEPVPIPAQSGADDFQDDDIPF